VGDLGAVDDGRWMMVDDFFSLDFAFFSVFSKKKGFVDFGVISFSFLGFKKEIKICKEYQQSDHFPFPFCRAIPLTLEKNRERDIITES